MSARRSPNAAAGFTLVEMLVAIVVGAIVVAGGVSLLISQQRTFQTSSSDRAMQDTARVALGEIGGTLRTAGYGVDPTLAFDFGYVPSATMLAAPRLPGLAVTNSANGGAQSYLCPNPLTCRDRVNGPDEIVFYARDPFFGHAAATAPTSTTSISISGPLRVELKQGQILQLMCTTGSMYWAYVTVGARVPMTTSAAAVVVPLRSGSGAELDFPFQNGVLTDPAASSCFTGGQVLVGKVDRYRYFIGNYDTAGNAVPALTVGSRPFLMLDQGLADEDGSPILTPVAPDVEDLQFSYLYPSGAVPVVGATAGTVIAAGAGGIDLAPADGMPGYGTPITNASRRNQSPSNIRGVRVSVVVRSAVADMRVTDAVVPAAANRPDLPGLPGYRRMRVETTIPVRNLDARYPYYPVLSTNNGADQNNVGGG